MKTAKILFLILLVMASKMQAQVNEKSIVGVWESDKKDVRMEFFKDGANYSAKLLWGNLVVEKDGITSKKDSKNPDVRLRSRNILGITSLTGLEWNGKEYTNGKIYDPPSGDTYTCKAWIEDGKLNLRGYLGISLLGKTVTWHRYK
ncbi:DUF2147 domain-containing protein [Flavobacterium sp. HBTb2-11-1]|uniref:DUF2147 domain-containing protein n=1 Tax=Flavobacterium sp. HBTb2-11-1 TaxID=2692212 RepID=UPI00136B3961|nr:DUF2147 domain-containing protein [Flavobacterium sp. HBTb2-11-1]MXO04454.1 DUF2147 domain-containing protein [Flavobacterium sp. HBTb2-11-1]